MITTNKFVVFFCVDHQQCIIIHLDFVINFEIIMSTRVLIAPVSLDVRMMLTSYSVRVAAVDDRGMCPSRLFVAGQALHIYFAVVSGGRSVTGRRRRRRRGNPCGWKQEAKSEKASIDVKYNMDTKVEYNTRLYKLQKTNFDREINTAVSLFINYSHGHLIF